MNTIYLIKNNLADAFMMLRTQGLKKTWKHYGWKLFAAIFLCYLIRDTLLYLVIPGLVIFATRYFSA